ncbi:MAG: transcription antitermination factor NusB [Actinobacteria bacterium]|jgi:transcription antitermination protein NusB|nr:transcription antitermination factor NusB [Actinomycetota bacterium]
MVQRSKARKEALDQLFQADLRKSEISIGASGEVRDYAAEILAGVKANNSRIDELIRSYIQGWDFDRIPSVDRNILRLAIWELLWSQTPEAVVIDEALKLATELSTENSATFIHGVLSKLASLKGQIAL